MSATSQGPVEAPGETPTRRRFFALPPGIMLALCIFAPALKVCDEPVYPIQMPMFWSPYLLGGVVAVMVLARSRGALTVAVGIGRALLAMSAIGAAFLFSEPKLLGIGAFVALPFVLYALVRATLHDDAECAAARVTFLVGVLCTLWFGFLSEDPDALWGAHLSLVSSIALIPAALAWGPGGRGRVGDIVPLARVVAG